MIGSAAAPLSLSPKLHAELTMWEIIYLERKTPLVGPGNSVSIVSVGRSKFLFFPSPL